MGSTSLRIASLNSKGHGIDRIDYIKTLMLSNDMLLLQEHWYVKSELSRLESELDDAHVIGISCIHEDTLLYGRPYGGCAIIYSKRLTCTYTPVSIDSRRCMGNIVCINGFKFLFINVYMPCDVHNGLINVDYDNVLHDINSCICNHPTIDHVIIGGDFNTDMSRTQSPHTIALREFCEHEDLLMCASHDTSIIDYTYESHAGNTSTIDHFLVSHNLWTSIISYEVLHHGDNLSDHSTIQICLGINTQRVCSKKQTSVHRPLWRSATNEHISKYKSMLSVLLRSVPIPSDMITCSNIMCTSLSHHSN